MAKKSAPVTVTKMRIKKGDRVRVIAGKDLGKEGDVMAVLPKANKVIVDGVNMARKHQRATRATMQAGIIDKDMPVHASNVMLVCPSCDKPTRVGYRGEGADKVRVCKQCGKTI
jgi:large subunit ribosomal protein L24